MAEAEKTEGAAKKASGTTDKGVTSASTQLTEKEPKGARRVREAEEKAAETERAAVDAKLNEIRPGAGSDLPAEALAVMPDQPLDETLRTPEVIESELDVPNRKAPLPTLPANHAFSARSAVEGRSTSTATEDEVNHARKLVRLEQEQEQDAKG